MLNFLQITNKKKLTVHVRYKTLPYSEQIFSERVADNIVQSTFVCGIFLSSDIENGTHFQNFALEVVSCTLLGGLGGKGGHVEKFQFGRKYQ